MAAPDLSAAAAPPADKPSSPRAWGIVGFLVLLMSVNFFDKAVMGLAAAPMNAELGLSTSEYGFISSSFFFLFSIAALGGGFLATRLSVRWILLGLAVVWAIAQVSVVFATGFAVLLISRLLLGAAEGPTFPLVNHMAYTWLYEKDRPLASSLLTAGASFGVLIGTPLITYFVVNHGWRSAFVVATVITLAWAAGWLFFGKEGPLSASHESSPSNSPEAEGAEKADDAGSTSESAPAVEPDPLHGLRTSYWRTFLSGTFLATSLLGFASYWLVAIYLTFMPLYLGAVLDMDLNSIGTFVMVKQAFALLVVYFGLAYFVRWLTGRGVSSRMTLGVINGSLVFFSGLCILGFVLLPGTGLKLTLAVIGQVGYLSLALGPVVCGKLASTKQRAGVMGTFAALYAIAGVVAPNVTGSMADSQDTVAGFQNSYLVMAALMLVAGLAAILFIHPDRDAAKLAASATAA